MDLKFDKITEIMKHEIFDSKPKKLLNQEILEVNKSEKNTKKIKSSE